MLTYNDIKWKKAEMCVVTDLRRTAHIYSKMTDTAENREITFIL